MREWRTKEIFEEIMVKNFLILVKTMHSQIQAAQRTQSVGNKTTPSVLFAT